MNRNIATAWLFGFMLACSANHLQAQPTGADEAVGIGVARAVEIKIGEGYVTGTESVEAKITVLEVVRGDKSWDLLKAASPSNKLPEVGMEYITARIRFEYGTKGGADQSYGIRDEQFASISEGGRQYERPSVEHPKPALNGRLYPGESLEGWITLLVPVENRKPLMTFGNNYNRAWFKLY
jgi:hypothetical protein